MIPVYLVDSKNKKPLKINGEGEIAVTLHSHPPLDEEIEGIPFSSYFENSGSNDLRVDGSTNPVYFSIDAIHDADIYIKTISIRISDSGAELDKFGALSALSTGCKFVYTTPKTGEIIIQDELKTNLDLIRLGHSTAGVGGGTDAFKSDINGAGNDTYLPVIDLSMTFGFPWGLRLKKDTVSSLSFVVHDDLSAGIGTFNIKGFGVQL